MKTFLSKLEKESLNVIDIRDASKFRNGAIPSAQNIPSVYLIAHPEKYLDKQKKYYIYCQSGHISNDIVNELNYLGYHTVNLIGGYRNYLLMK